MRLGSIFNNWRYDGGLFSGKKLLGSVSKIGSTHTSPLWHLGGLDTPFINICILSLWTTFKLELFQDLVVVDKQYIEAHALVLKEFNMSKSTKKSC